MRIRDNKSQARSAFFLFIRIDTGRRTQCLVVTEALDTTRGFRTSTGRSKSPNRIGNTLPLLAKLKQHFDHDIPLWPP